MPFRDGSLSELSLRTFPWISPTLPFQSFPKDYISPPPLISNPVRQLKPYIGFKLVVVRIGLGQGLVGVAL